jgi:hypothetical protein
LRSFWLRFIIFINYVQDVYNQFLIGKTKFLLIRSLIIIILIQIVKNTLLMDEIEGIKGPIQNLKNKITKNLNYCYNIFGNNDNSKHISCLQKRTSP